MKVPHDYEADIMIRQEETVVQEDQPLPYCMEKKTVCPAVIPFFDCHQCPVDYMRHDLTVIQPDQLPCDESPTGFCPNIRLCVGGCTCSFERGDVI